MSFCMSFGFPVGGVFRVLRCSVGGERAGGEGVVRAARSTFPAGGTLRTYVAVGLSSFLSFFVSFCISTFSPGRPPRGSRHRIG